MAVPALVAIFTEDGSTRLQALCSVLVGLAGTALLVLLFSATPFRRSRHSGSPMPPMPATTFLPPPVPARPPANAELASRLHDTVGQGLTAIALQVRAADQHDRRLQAIGETAAQTMVELREFMGQLRGEENGSGSDGQCLVDVVNRMRLAGLNIVFRSHGTDEHLPGPQRAAIARVARESLTNAWKHYPETPVLLEFQVDHHVRLRVSSISRSRSPLRGGLHLHGASPDRTPWSGGQGSRSMQRLVAEHGGSLMTGDDERGFIVMVELPLARCHARPSPEVPGRR